MPDFNSSPAFANAYSYSYNWPSRTGPANDGSCNENVAVAVLNKFNIPIIGAHPIRGNLCGVDINNMPAKDAIQLSLAENMIDGKFIELNTTAEGFAYFQEVYPNPEVVNLEIRTCIPTSNIDNVADLVIVRGYDSPPVRYFKDFEGLKWDPVESLSNHIDPVYCQGHQFATEAWKSYKDPVLETSYKDGVENLYELKAFESLVGYVIDFDGSSDVNVKYSFSNSTTKLIDIDFPGLSCCESTLVCDETGSSRVLYAKYSKSLGNFAGEDKFGNNWPLLMSVQGVYVFGQQIKYLTDSTAAGGGYVGIYVEDKKKLISVPANNWYWELDSNSAATIHLYSSTYEGDPIMDTLRNSGGRQKVIPVSESSIVTSSESGVGSVATFPGINGSSGMVVYKCIVAVEIDRPSCVISDPNGDALGYARELDVSYQPVIVQDNPPPVAYCNGGSAQLIDQTLDLYDSDPSTQQTPPSLVQGSLAWLQTQTTGRTVDVSMPFCDEEGCLQMAETIYGLQDENINSYQMVCGPNSEPVLGAKVAGYEGRINRISYSYTDSSSYTVNVTVGPTFLNAKGWNTSLWQRKTSDVSREGIITWAAGDGVNYRVSVQGLGNYPAINKTLGCYVPGEKVRVTIHNLPQET